MCFQRNNELISDSAAIFGRSKARYTISSVIEVACSTYSSLGVWDVQSLTAAQEAYLDTQSYPWYPDVWQIAGLLTEAAQKEEQPSKRGSHRKGTPSSSAELAKDSLDLDPTAGSQLQPRLSAFHMLVTPPLEWACVSSVSHERQCLAFAASMPVKSL